MGKEDSLTIYWAPFQSFEVENAGEWNMLYPEPQSLMSDLMSIKSPERGTQHFFSCPASSDYFKKTFVFYNGLESSYEYDLTDSTNPIVNPKSDGFLGWGVERPPTLVGRPQFTLNLRYIFFSEESVEITTSSPHFHKPEYTQYGACAPGKMDIGQWFRPYSMELQLWRTKGVLHIKENEPLFYVNVNTDRPVKLQKFHMNAALSALSQHCVKSPFWQGSNLPLAQRYQAFSRSKTGSIVLKEIKKNLL